MELELDEKLNKLLMIGVGVYQKGLDEKYLQQIIILA